MNQAVPLAGGPPLGPPPAASLVAAVAANARSHPTGVAVRRYRLGRWHELSWRDLALASAGVAAGLRQLGLDRGARVALLASNRPEWLVADLAVQSLGAVTVGIDPSWRDEHLLSVLQSTGCRAVIAQDGVQLERAAAMRARCPSLEAAVVIDDRGLDLAGSSVVAWTSLTGETGPSAPGADAVDGGEAALATLEGAAAALCGADPTIMIVAEPDGAPPLGILLSHAGLVAAGASFAAATDLRADDELLAQASPVGVAGRIANMAAPTLARAPVNYGAGAESLAADLRFVQPTVLLAGTGVWELVRGEVERRMADASALKRRVYGWARRSGARGSTGLGPRLRWVLVDRSLRGNLGLRRLRLGLADGGRATDETARFFSGLGVTVVRTVSNRESGCFVALGDRSVGLAGSLRPAPGVEVALDPEGLLLTRTESALVGWVDGGGSGVPVDGGWVTTGHAASVGADGSLAISADHAAGDGAGAAAALAGPALEAVAPLEETRP